VRVSPDQAGFDHIAVRGVLRSQQSQKEVKANLESTRPTTM